MSNGTKLRNPTSHFTVMWNQTVDKVLGTRLGLRLLAKTNLLFHLYSLSGLCQLCFKIAIRYIA